jgi:hypothetical protein
VRVLGYTDPDDGINSQYAYYYSYMFCPPILFELNELRTFVDNSQRVLIISTLAEMIVVSRGAGLRFGHQYLKTLELGCEWDTIQYCKLVLAGDQNS